MVNCFVQMFPPSVECHRAAFPPKLPEKAVMTISFGFARLNVIDVSPSLNVSVFVRLGSVLFTTASTIKTAGRSGIGLMPFGAKSSRTAGRV
jgi:hypothetical protein